MMVWSKLYFQLLNAVIACLYLSAGRNWRAKEDRGYDEIQTCTDRVVCLICLRTKQPKSGFPAQ